MPGHDSGDAGPGCVLELDATATVPDDGWTVETITGTEETITGAR